MAVVRITGDLERRTGDGKIAEYDVIRNTPIIKGVLPLGNPQANTYYQHTGENGTYKQGAIYFYNGSDYKIISGLTAGAGIKIDSNNKISAELTVNASDYNGSAVVANDTLILNDENDTYDDTEIRELINNKQDKLVSGTNVKTVNGQSLLGSGDITIEGGGDAYNDTEIKELINTKQNKLVAGTGITIDSNNKISAKVTVNSSEYSGSATVANEVLILNDEASGSGTYNDTELRELINDKQDILVSNKNIKTINGISLLGSGDITIEGGSGGGTYDDTELRDNISALETSKQDKLTAGAGIKIDSNNKISAELTVNASNYNGQAAVANEVLILNDENDTYDDTEIRTAINNKIDKDNIIVENNTLKIIL